MATVNASRQRWICVGDIHDSPENIRRIPEIAGATGIIVTGDLTMLGGIDKAAAVMTVLRQTGLPVWAQIGNMDLPEVNDWLTSNGCNLHVRTLELWPGTAIFGVGASTITPFRTPSEFSEETYASWLDKCWENASGYSHHVLISHNPPRETACDAIPGGQHVGSQALRDFIEARQPDICVCGHIHESRGTDNLGQCLIINPGPLAEGGYVVLENNDGVPQATLKVLDSAS